MTKKALLALACLLILDGVQDARAQRWPEPAVAPPAPPLVAAPNSSVPAPAAASAPGAHVMPPLAPSAALAPAAPMPPSVHGVAPVVRLADAPPAPPQRPGEATVFFGVGDNYLGVEVEEVTRENMGRYNLSGEPRGVGVREVVKGSPAERAGVREGDVILRFDGEQVTSVRKLTRLIDESAPEHAARLTVRRGGSEQELTVTLGRREFGREFGSLMKGEAWPKKLEEMRQQMGKLEGFRLEGPRGLLELAAASGRRIGVSANTLTRQLAAYFGVDRGVLVTNVEEGSPAERAGLKAGDIIVEADGKEVEDAGDLSRALNARQDGAVSLTVVRDRNRRNVQVTPERRKGPGIELTPGLFRIEPPSIAITAPAVTVAIPAIDVPLPNITITPRMRVVPRTAVTRPGRVL